MCPRSYDTLGFARGLALWLAQAGLTLVVGTAAVSEPLRAQPKPDSSGFITTGDGVRLYFAIYGSTRDTVIVPGAALLAGQLSSLHEGITLVFYDPRGRGRSDWVADPKRLTRGRVLVPRAHDRALRRGSSGSRRATRATRTDGA